jgi:hypothetical protein
MFRTPLQWLILTSITFTVFAGQSTPWDNVLEAVLFSSNPTDLDDSGETDVSDLLILISDWGPCGGCSSDFDENGIVNVTDLLTLIDAWGANEMIELDEIDIDRAGVPCFAYGPDGELIQMFQWFPNKKDSTVDFIARRVSYDQGETWSAIQGIIWSGGPPPNSFSTQADPSLVLLEEGDNVEGIWRLFFTCDIDKAGSGLPKTYSAISDDGLHFTWEDWDTPRMEYSGYGLLDPSVIYFNGEYHYFAPVPGQSYGSVYATSSDGYTFTQHDNIEIEDSFNTKFMGNPAVVDEKLYFFGTLESDNAWNGIFYAESDDANNWTVLYEESGTVADPAGIQTDEGMLLFKTSLYH